ncbi:MAG: hypothetical protein HDR88_01400 [Bacteroides sp.]|nr:hypothetical protein [Bacteroides sp.]
MEKRIYKSWTISDELWEYIKEKITKCSLEKHKVYKRKSGFGRDILRLVNGLLVESSTQGMWSGEQYP